MIEGPPPFVIFSTLVAGMVYLVFPIQYSIWPFFSEALSTSI